MDSDGSWAPHDYLIKLEDDVEILKYILKNTSYTANNHIFTDFLEQTKGFGVCDAVIRRSPFGKIVHEYLGFEETIYKIFDNEAFILEIMEAQELLDIQLIQLAADTATDIVIISDHADENLIPPPYFEKYCFPFYNKACDILHARGKYVSTHLDGNIKGYMNIFHKSKLDLLDGCTPAPMFNYTPQELANSIKGSKSTYLGVPSSMFVQNTYSSDAIHKMAEDIIDSFDSRVILNIGDLLPINGDIQHVIDLGKHIKNL